MTVIMAVVLSSSVVSCSSNDDDSNNGTKSMLVGTWSSAESKNDDYYKIWTFNSNGTGTTQKIDQGYSRSFHSIAYSYDGNTLTIAETDDDDIHTYKVLILTDKVLGIQDSKGNAENFRKQ